MNCLIENKVKLMEWIEEKIGCVVIKKYIKDVLLEDKNLKNKE